MAGQYYNNALLVDTGGTNTRLAFARNGEIDPESIRSIPNANFEGFAPLLRSYLIALETDAVDACCVAAAGPVANGVAELTNLDWTIDKDVIRDGAGTFNGFVINDLQAQGYGVASLEKSKISPLLPGASSDERATKLVIGVGTGFNAAPVTFMADILSVPPAEAGHVSLPIQSETDQDLASFIIAEEGFASVEDALSGRGLELLYQWAAHGDSEARSAQEIMASLAAGNDPIADAAMRQFTRTLGAVAGNLCLNFLPFGGVYLIGGVARSAAPYLLRFGFESAFTDKGRFSEFLKAFPVSVIQDDFAALTGCLVYLKQDLSLR